MTARSALVFFFLALLVLAQGRHWFARPVLVSPSGSKRPRSTFLKRFSNHQRLRLRGGQDEEADTVATNVTEPQEEEGTEEVKLPTNTTLQEDEEDIVSLEEEEDIAELHVDTEVEEDYYFSDSDIENEVILELAEELDEGGEELAEEDAIDVVVETVFDLSRRTSILAWKASKVTAFWFKQWSLDVYRACMRAVEAGRLELEEGGDDIWLIAELSDAEEASRFQGIKKKAMRLSKRCFKTAKQMTIAFWSMDDDDDFLFDQEGDEDMFQQPSISFFSKFKLHKEYQEEEKLEEENSSAAEKVCAKCVGGDGTVPTKRRRSRTAATKDALKSAETTTVTIIPKVSKGRKLLVNLVVGVASIVLWEQVGGQALLSKGVQMVMQSRSTEKRNDK